MSQRVLVTGASGFVGSVLCRVLADAGYSIRAALRSDRQMPEHVPEKVIVGDIGSATEWTAALEHVQYVVHAAARVHMMGESADNADKYFESNERGTLRLATESARAGVRRLLYLSSVKAAEVECAPGILCSPPHDPYALSKWRGESHVVRVSIETGMDVAIIRPPLVYGPAVRANFLRLMKWVDNEYPLPLAAVDNRRSLVSVWNLCDLLLSLLQQSRRTQQTWMVSDGEDLSTPDLIRRIGRAMGRRVRLLWIPPQVLQWAGGLIGSGSEISRLCDSLTVDIGSTCEQLGWRPPLSVDEGIARTVEWYLSESRSK